MNRESITSLHAPQMTMGVLTENELLLVGLDQGKRVLHSRLLPREAHDLAGLLEYLWQQEVTSVWVLPSTGFSQRVTCTELRQASAHWTTLVHPAPSEPTRPSSALIWPKNPER